MGTDAQATLRTGETVGVGVADDVVDGEGVGELDGDAPTLSDGVGDADADSEDDAVAVTGWELDAGAVEEADNETDGVLVTLSEAAAVLEAVGVEEAIADVESDPLCDAVQVAD